MGDRAASYDASFTDEHLQVYRNSKQPNQDAPEITRDDKLQILFDFYVWHEGEVLDIEMLCPFNALPLRIPCGTLCGLFWNEMDIRRHCPCVKYGPENAMKGLYQVLCNNGWITHVA